VNRRRRMMLTLIPLLLVSGPIHAQFGGWHYRSLADVKLAAEQGDRNALLELGIRYEEGRGVQQSLTKAIRLYRSAASTVLETSSYRSPYRGSGATGPAAIEVHKRPRFPAAEARLKNALRLRSGEHAR
jgi:hypothetical protein